MSTNKNTVGEEAAKSEATAARWLSEGLEELVRDCEPGGKLGEADPHFDVVIVGSGYGGALAADELAGGIEKETGKPMRICVLERGREYLAGMFPSSEADLPGSITFNAPNSPDPYAATDGVLDLRLGEDVSVMLASGLGGGSLINAGVMAVPEPWVFKQPCWPKALQKDKELDDWYDAARSRLAPGKDETGKAKFAKPHAVEKRDALFRLHPEGPLRSQLQVGRPTPVDSSIATDATENAAGISLNACKQCGDCMTGCNHQAKNSLDQNLLVRAKRGGVRIVCGASVVKLIRAEPENISSPWLLEIVHTDPLLRRRREERFLLSARRVILAAGTLGSTEILLRSRTEELKFSPQLGQRFSTNGDFIAASYGERKEVNAVATASQPFDQRKVGPTITGMMKVGEGEDQITIEELAIPGTMRRLFEEGFTTAHLFHRLGAGDPEGLHLPRQGCADPYAVQHEKIRRTQVLGVIGHDGAKGRLVLRSSGKTHEAGHPHFQSVTVLWPELRQRGGIFDRQVDKLSKLIANSRSGGVLLPNPFWQLLPAGITQLLDMPRGPALTTHPLGGCPMADSWQEGVVNEHGEVFDAATRDKVHPGLVVLDGAIIPRSLGTNPAFTISALVLRALHSLKAKWTTKGRPAVATEVPPMPAYKTPQPALEIPTKIAIHERLVGDLDLALESPWKEKYTFELTLQFKPTAVRKLATSMDRTLEVDPQASCLRVFKAAKLRGLREVGETEFRCEQHAVFRATVGGTMRLLDREASGKPWRILRGIYAWWHNRGKRDLWNSAITVVRREGGIGLWEYVRDLLHVASHAGEARLFDYNLIVGDRLPPLKLRRGKGVVDAGRIIIPKETLIRGRKRLTYERRSNPWTQMLEVTLTEISVLPGDVARAAWLPEFSPERPTVLRVDGKHYARERKHLFEITQSRDGVTGMFDLFSFALYALRLVAAVHLWSFRKPDEPSRKAPNRLPGELPGIPPPVIAWIPIKTSDERTKRNREVKVRLARYQNDEPKPPVLLIHGYSASGTTFAHPALRPGLAEYLYKAGRDVWVVDLRTSAGLESSKHHWTFEQVATEDIPAVFDYIVAATGAKKIDVVAHCMGAAMFSMALLAKDSQVDDLVRNKDSGVVDLEHNKKPRVVDLVHKVVLSQVGPMVAFTPANIFRAYAVSYIQEVLRESNFEFRPEPGLNGAFLDRLLATVPYPREEFDFENPPEPWARTPYTTTRHRMDAWFGRAFNVANMDAGMLEHIDDFFGAINLDTLFQTIHFARNSMITTKSGGNAFLIPERFERLRGIPFFSIHGAENGLADPATLMRMRRLMNEVGITFQQLMVPKFGHQDCVMGREAPTKVFPEIVKFLDARMDDSGAAGAVRGKNGAGNRATITLPITPWADPGAAPEKSAAGNLAKIHTKIVDWGDTSARQVQFAGGKYTAHLPFMGPLVSLPDAKGESAVAFAAGPKFGPPVGVVWIPVANVGRQWRAAILTQLESGIPPGWLIQDPVAAPGERNDLSISEWLETPRWYRHSMRSGPDRPRAWLPVLICGALEGTTMDSNLNAILSLTKTPWENDTDFLPLATPGPLAQPQSEEPIIPRDLTGDSLVMVAKDRVAALEKKRPAVATALRDLLSRTSITELKQAQVVLPRPNTGSDTLRFAVASCQYPAGPLDPGLAAASYARLGKRLGSARPPRCAVLMGDQIYADATAGLFDPSQMDDRYELPYQEWLQTPAVRNVLRRLPMYAMLDDHEIDNNWERNFQDPKCGRRRANGVKAYFRVQRAAGEPVRGATVKRIPVWYEAKIDGFDFFFVDGRSERQMRTAADLDRSKMIDDYQMSALTDWLNRTVADRPRFVVCGSILVPRRKTTAGGPAGALNSDAWDGYPATFHEVLAHIANRNLRNLVFLSGDEHHSCIATARLVSLDEQGNECREPAVLHSIHSSALYAPFPFANGEPAQLAGQEVFTFANPELLYFPTTRHIRCEVSTHFVTERGDGFAMLDCRPGKDVKWEICCEFSRPDNSDTYVLDPLHCRRVP